MKRVGLALLIGVAPAALADTATLTWTNPTQYTDGTLLDQAIARTNLRCTALVVGGVRNPCPLADQAVIGAGTIYSWTYTVTAYTSGTICFAAQTQLADASLSDWSVEGCKAFSATKKAKPPTLTVR
jgi:hypothetical protein